MAPDISKCIKQCDKRCLALISKIASQRDSTDWLTLAPPNDDETSTYASANPELCSLACAMALFQCKKETLARGQLYPFIMGDQKTNSLLFMAEWMCDRQAAQLVLSKKIRSSEGLELCHEHGTLWHLLKIVTLLKKFPGCNDQAFDPACSIAAHAVRSEDKELQGYAERLAQFCFILKCPSMPCPPTSNMLSMVIDRMHDKPCSNERVSLIFPKIITDIIFETQKKMHKAGHTTKIHGRLLAFNQFHSVPQSLLFDV